MKDVIDDSCILYYFFAHSMCQSIGIFLPLLPLPALPLPRKAHVFHQYGWQCTLCKFGDSGELVFTNFFVKISEWDAYLNRNKIAISNTSNLYSVM